MVGAVVLLGGFDGNDVADVFDDADELLVAAAVGADSANVCIADVAAPLAMLDVLAHSADGVAEMGDVVHVLAQQMQHQAEGGFFANARQLRKFIDRIFE